MKNLRVIIRLIYYVGLLSYVGSLLSVIMFVYVLFYGHGGGVLILLVYANLLLLLGMYCSWRYGKLKEALS